MKTIIIYYSKTGFAKKYSEWLKEEIGGELYALKDVKNINLSKYDMIIFTSSVCAGKVKKLNWFKKYVEGKVKDSMLLICGASSSNDNEIKETIKRVHKEENIKSHLFYVQSGLSYEKMGFVDKLLMSGLCKFLKKQHGADSEIYKKIANSFDDSKKERLVDIVNYIEEKQNKK